MEKIAFVVVRYGKEINGGAEFHCKMLAERLTGRYQVEVLTTCVKNYLTGGNEFPEGEENINGVVVRRFKAAPIHKEKLHSYVRKAKRARKLRRFLYQCRLLGLVSCFRPVWTYRKEFEIKALNSSVFYSPSLVSFIKEHKKEYKAFIPISLDYPHMYYTALHAPEKTLVIPTMHYHSISFRSILTQVFTKAAYIGFNTHAEEKLGRRIFGHRMSHHGIISVGIEMVPPADWATTSAKYGLPSEYLLYVGRVDRNKLHHIFKYFIAYKKTYKDTPLKLVMVGGLFTETFEHPDIIYTGFVSEHEKTAIIQHAKIVVNPSKYESLSLILLEAMSQKKPVLVNGLCNVLKEHCKKSRHAALAYFNKQDFIRKLHRIDSSEKLRTEMGEKGAEYVEKNYNWELILKNLTTAIEYIGKKND
ncbi:MULTISPECIES: glycosyltransferase family 4 protein [unclassified Bacteroides]|uniref:glycosyltransferase family 4 protein n=1 Tax=unclassified Bacteroides TaxID=2646097 RepID=UPI0040628D8E